MSEWLEDFLLGGKKELGLQKAFDSFRDECVEGNLYEGTVISVRVSQNQQHRPQAIPTGSEKGFRKMGLSL